MSTEESQAHPDKPEIAFYYPGPSVNQRVALVIYLLIAEAVLFLYGIYLSIFFSLKYEQTRQFLADIEAGEDLPIYNSIISSRLRGSPRLDAIDKSLTVIGILLHLAFYIYYFFSKGNT